LRQGGCSSPSHIRSRPVAVRTDIFNSAPVTSTAGTSQSDNTADRADMADSVVGK
jgi:hypothetical protein